MPDYSVARRLSPNAVALGCVSLLTAVSSAMIHSLLPIYLVRVLGASITTLGLIEGAAEAASALLKLFSGTLSDRLGRRKPLLVLGYALSAGVKTLFPLASSASTVLFARVAERLGKGLRDAPRDAFLADITPPEVRGAGFGLRLAMAFAGFVVGPLIATALMRISNDDYRLVFWGALVPAYFAVLLVLLAIKEEPRPRDACPPAIRWTDIAALPPALWWTIAMAGVLSLARFSPAFLILKVHDIGVDAAYVPLCLMLMYLMYSLTAYPLGMLSDRFSRRTQLGIGIFVLVVADILLANANDVWWTAVGTMLWGLHLGLTQGLMAAAIADAAPDRLRGTAFGLYDLAIGATAFAASATAGLLWQASGAHAAFGLGACIAAGALMMLRLAGLPDRYGSRTTLP